MQRGLSYERLSVRLSNAWIVTKRKHLANSITTNRKSPTSFPMSLRWTPYVAPNPLKGASKMPFFSFSVWKIDFARRKSATKFLCAKAVSCKVVGHSLAYLTMQNGWWETSPSTWNFGGKLTYPHSKWRFQSLFARSTPAIAPSEKSSNYH